ncbi:MAG TPA: hypothetical protein VGL11_23750 [Candidatus Binatia bacterium]|jgi:gentisate 1,2-dioxygenase
MSKTASKNFIDPAAFYEDVKRMHLRPLWLQQAHGPHKLAVPYLWKWPEVRAQMMRASEVVSTENVERRVLGLMNPGLENSGRFATTPNLVAAIQMIMPGETALAHHHTPAALRIIIEGNKFEWSERDIFVVPGWHWHEHVNASARDEAILISYTDEPLLKMLGIHREESQE